MFQLIEAFTRRVEGHYDRRPVQTAGRLRQTRPQASAAAPGGGPLPGRGTESRNFPKLFAVLAWALVLSVTSLTLPGAARAQVLYGSLTGNVTDPAGAAVPGAKVEVTNVSTNETKSVTSDERGGYEFSNLQVGVYRLTVSLS